MSQELVPLRGPAPSRSTVGPIDPLLGAARFAARTWFRGASWSVGLSVRVVRVWGNSEASAELVRDVVASFRGLVEELLEVSDVSLDRRIRRRLPPDAVPARARDGDGRAVDLKGLRERAEELLRQAADIHFEERAHPAYARILLELAADEARILRLLAREGPQPAVDVRSIGLARSGKLVAQGVNMVAEAAGARHPERAEVYLDNLGRLGLTVLATEALEDQIAYQVLEAQPDVLAAVRQAGRARTIQRSIRLTPFGSDFCRVCLPPEPPAPVSARSPRPD
jgi:hypothetical protein